jgi:AcrR family transcriptional regulator
MKELSRRDREQQEREELIISKAEELFCEYGFDNVSMDTIARETEFTKRTVYRYFNSKEDLFFAAALKGHRYLCEMLDEAVKKGNTGFEKIRFSYYAYYEFITKYPKLAQLVNKRRYMSDDAGLDSPFYKKFNELDGNLFEGLRQTYLKGKEDGSIRSDLDTDELAFSTIYVAVGFFQLLSFSGDTYTKHYGFDKDKFVRFTIERMLDSVKTV